MAKASVAPKQGRRSVLVVGGKSQATQTVCLLLRRFAYDVAAAETATEGLTLVAASAPALVIADMVIPGMNGMDFFNAVKRVRRSSAVPFVFLVPMSDAAAERRCLENGAAGCISKPVQVEELYRTVQSILEPLPRGNIRIGTRLLVSIDNDPLSFSEAASAIDLSEQGMYMPMHRPFARNSRLTVHLHIKDRTISTVSTVLYSSPSRSGLDQKPGMGLKFVTIAPQDREFIRKFIREEIARDVGGSSSCESRDTWR